MIEIKKLTKKYGSFKACDDVNLEVMPGKITVLLGPNGAGKSTTIKSIANLLDFNGTVSICGYPNDTIEAKKCFGYISETPILYDALTVDEHINFIGRAYKVNNYHELADTYLKLFKMNDKRKKLASELSKGMKQKLSIILALIINPKALLVDEPMIGLDPEAIEDVLKVFEKMKEDGCAILISTHIIDIINDIYDEAYIMNEGKIVKHLKREELNEASLKDYFLELTNGDNNETDA